MRCPGCNNGDTFKKKISKEMIKHSQSATCLKLISLHTTLAMHGCASRTSKDTDTVLMKTTFHTIESELKEFSNRLYSIPNFSRICNIDTPSHILTPPPQSQQVAHSLDNNGILTPYRFYTDGSLSNLGSPQIKLGFGWLQLTDDDQIISECSHSILSSWPSSTKAEASAILSIIEQLPPRAFVSIYLDSKVAIDTVKSLLDASSHLHKSFLTRPHHNLWARLLELIKENCINLSLFKVVAHSNDLFNDRADYLARQGADSSYSYLPSSSSNPLISFHAWWNDLLPIDSNIRHLIKDTHNARLHEQFTSLNRFQPLSTKSDPVNWIHTWSSFQFTLFATRL